MPLDGCHNLHRWSKDQAQRWQSGNLPSDPSIPGLLGFEKEEDLEETKVYIRRLWLATENAKASNPVFLDYNAAQLWKRTTELVNSLVRDEDKLCAELAKDEIIQTCFGPGPAGNKPRVCSAFLKDDIERILVYEGFGELIWGSRNIAASQLSNPYSGDDKRQPRWGACDQKGRYSANDQDTHVFSCVRKESDTDCYAVSYWKSATGSPHAFRTRSKPFVRSAVCHTRFIKRTVNIWTVESWSCSRRVALHAEKNTSHASTMKYTKSPRQRRSGKTALTSN
jgi:hypothetical protein